MRAGGAVLLHAAPRRADGRAAALDAGVPAHAGPAGQLQTEARPEGTGPEPPPSNHLEMALVACVSQNADAEYSRFVLNCASCQGGLADGSHAICFCALSPFNYSSVSFMVMAMTAAARHCTELQAASKLPIRLCCPKPAHRHVVAHLT